MSQYFSMFVSKKAAFLQWITAILRAVRYVRFSKYAVVFSSSDGVG